MKDIIKEETKRKKELIYKRRIRKICSKPEPNGSIKVYSPDEIFLYKLQNIPEEAMWR